NKSKFTNLTSLCDNCFFSTTYSEDDDGLVTFISILAKKSTIMTESLLPFIPGSLEISAIKSSSSSSSKK
ncbi:hypothetical protein BLA29_013525, partial [Euroglyphus maynei]